MHRIDTSTAQVDKFGAGKNGFTAGNPQTGTPATDLDEAFFDMLQEELAGVVESSGVALDKTKHNQLLTALKALLLTRANPFADIKADGTTVAALGNLGAAPLASPNLTGTPTAPTAVTGTNTTQIATMAALQAAINDAHTFAASGYQRLPSSLPDHTGLMIQWGSGLVSTPGTSQTYTLPQAFTTAFYQILISHDDGLSTTTNIAAFAAAPVTSSLTQFSAVGYHLNGASTSCGFRYIAIGR
ncbi:hypothetical protein N7922_06035 [Kosakonia sp. ML.JS2a]|uniref:gp53-like domain-containing protein n=1 Tax=Kosakonia sp. ML.JS2a TaxID=2980557 RepID=UPI0021DAFECF|nr:hypothetical protein [Kosakonia sp. ML.JS2a]UXY12085.1 hypothetical protein N7922_06035 [Kosakonia sp. ML.JS2a]